MKEILTVAEAAGYLGCHQMTVRKLINRREIPFIRKKGIGMRLRTTDIEEWLDSDYNAPHGWGSGKS